MLTPSQLQQYRRDGFLRGGQVIADAPIDQLHVDLARVIADRGKGGRQPVQISNFGGEKSPLWQVVNIWQASDAYRALIDNPTIVEEAAQLLGSDDVLVWHDQIQFKPPTVGGINMWHQDWPYWPILDRPDQVTAWIALDDADVDNGCMSMVPGSHAWGNAIGFLHTLKDFTAMPDEWQGHRLEVRLCPVPKGHVHFHHALTWHGSHANLSGRPRRALAIHFMAATTRYVASGKHPMKPFVETRDGEPVRGAGFPWVRRSASAAAIA